MSSEARGIAHELRREYRFDVASDSFDVDLDRVTSIAVSRDGTPREEAPRPLTRKDKRREKTGRRKAKRILAKLGYNVRAKPREIEDTSSASVVAGVCHA